MSETSPLHPSELAVLSADSQWTRHQIRDQLQMIHIGLHLLEHHLDIQEMDLQEELTSLRAALRKTVRVMEKMLHAQMPTP